MDMGNLEQPENENIEQGKGILQVENINNGSDGSNDNGSKLGKFKDATALLSAYNSLQSDYTKKCQTLANLQKKLQDKGSLLQELSPEKKLENNSTVVKENTLQNAKDNLKDMLENSLKENGLEKTTEENSFPSEEKSNGLSSEDLLQEYIFSQPELKNKILQKYFSELNIPPSPKLIGEDTGAGTVVAPISKPKTLQDAERAVMDLFNKNN